MNNLDILDGLLLDKPDVIPAEIEKGPHHHPPEFFEGIAWTLYMLSLSYSRRDHTYDWIGDAMRQIARTELDTLDKVLEQAGAASGYITGLLKAYDIKVPQH